MEPSTPALADIALSASWAGGGGGRGRPLIPRWEKLCESLVSLTENCIQLGDWCVWIFNPPKFHRIHLILNLVKSNLILLSNTWIVRAKPRGIRWKHITVVGGFFIAIGKIIPASIGNLVWNGLNRTICIVQLSAACEQHMQVVYIYMHQTRDVQMSILCFLSKRENQTSCSFPTRRENSHWILKGLKSLWNEWMIWKQFWVSFNKLQKNWPKSGRWLWSYHIS